MTNTGFQSVDEYNASLPKETQATLEKVRAVIKSIAPEAIENISIR